MLQQLQRTFITALKSGNSSAFLQHIHPNPRVSSATQFSIYQDSITARFQRALKDIYPVCQQLVGEEFFLAMATHYIDETPSMSPDLNDYGADFANFIDKYPPASTLPYLGDVARLEWAWHRIAGAPDQNSFDFAKLAACYEAGDNLIFTLPSRCTLLTSPYPIHTIWETNQKNYQGDDTITLADDERYYFLIWRNQYELRIDSLSITQWQLLTLIQAKLPLASICEHATAIDEALDIPMLLSQWVQSGWIAGFMSS
jgi:hypothetical protein